MTSSVRSFLKLSPDAAPFRPANGIKSPSPPPDDTTREKTTKCMQIGCNNERKPCDLCSLTDPMTFDSLSKTEYYCSIHVKCEIKNCNRRRELNGPQCSYHQVCGVAGCGEIPIVFADYSVCKKHTHVYRCGVGMCGKYSAHMTVEERLIKNYFPNATLCNNHIHIGNSIYYRANIIRMIDNKSQAK
jgi:hypothetical protein